MVDTYRDWRTQGNCAGRDPETMYPEELRGEARRRATRAAERLCASCPVTTECLGDALDMQDWHGVRAGLTGEKRRQLLADRLAVAR